MEYIDVLILYTYSTQRNNNTSEIDNTSMLISGLFVTSQNYTANTNENHERFIRITHLYFSASDAQEQILFSKDTDASTKDLFSCSRQ